MEGERSTVFYPSLQQLGIEGCPNLKGWRSKVADVNDDDDGDTTTTIGLPQFPCLSQLEIFGCHKLTEMPLFPTLDDVLVLADCSLEPLRQTMLASEPPSTSSAISAHSKLTTLTIISMDDHELLPEDGFWNPARLQQLEILNCPRLRSLPRGMQELTSLLKLRISKSAELSERYSVDWPIIAQTPTIQIEEQYIRRDGRHM